MKALNSKQAAERKWTEDGTCSVRCLHCNARCWFWGNLDDAPLTFNCPDCGKITFNKFNKEAQK